MNVAGVVLTDLIHLFKIFIVFKCFFKFNVRSGERKKLRLLVIAFVMLITSVFININDNEVFNSIVYTISIIAFVGSVFSGKITRIILSTLWVIITLSVMDIMFKVFVNMIILLAKLTIMDYVDLIASILSMIFIGNFANVFVRKRKISLRNANVGSLVFFTIVAAVDMIVIMVIAGFIETEYMDNVFIVAMFCMVVLGTIGQLAVIIMLFVQRNLYQEEKKLTQNHLNEQKKYYEYLEMREKDTKKFRHDIINHMEMLRKLIERQELSEVDKYLSKINHRIEGFGNAITVNNGIVDAIINQYYSIAQEKSVDMKVLGMFPVDCDIDAYDLCTIFSNMLCNAVEAAAETEEKKITLNCRYTDDDIVILAENTFNNIGQFKDGLIKTTKFNKENHGFGLENIRECVSLNHGHMYIEIKGNKFVLKILLKRRVIDNENSNC